MRLNSTSFAAVTSVIILILNGIAAAHLHPGQGRFVQRDPLEYADAMNCVAYQVANPVGRLDALGLDACDGTCPTPWTAGAVFGVQWQYGCYCGLEPVPPRATIPPPIDGVDTCCQQHDACYGPPPGPPPAVKAVCDANLCACAKHAAQTGGCLSIRCQNAATQIQAWYGPC